MGGVLGNMPRYVTQHDVPYNNDFVLHKILKVETYLHISCDLKYI